MTGDKGTRIFSKSRSIGLVTTAAQNRKSGTTIAQRKLGATGLIATNKIAARHKNNAILRPKSIVKIAFDITPSRRAVPNPSENLRVLSGSKL